MYNEVKCICITCDNCGETFLDDHSGFSIYSDKDAAHDAADQDEWHSEGGTHYCPKCHSYDDNDELVIDKTRLKPSDYEQKKLTLKQKLEALAAKYYSGLKWEPEVGDYYTTSRADLELYQVVDITDDKIKTTYLIPDSQISEWDKDKFLTKDFGVNRVFVPPYVFQIKE